MSIRVEQEGPVVEVIMDRPEKRNALTLDMRVELAEVFERLNRQEEVRCIIITGAGGSFCSGADVGGMAAGDIRESRARIRILHRLVRAVVRIEKPVIAAVKGHAAGFGWSLALATDIVLAGTSARFTQAFRNVGLAPDGGAAYFLPRLIGIHRAKELAYTARTIGADEAFSLGLVSRIVDDEELMPTARKLAAEFAAGPPLALACTKQLFAAAQSASLDDYLDQEYLVQPTLQQTQDHNEGVAAFREKRAPCFRGK